LIFIKYNTYYYNSDRVNMLYINNPLINNISDNKILIKNSYLPKLSLLFSGA